VTDIVIIGAGPAGLSAAAVCAEHQLKVLVIDEFMKPGGRLLGQLHREKNGTWWNGWEESASLTRRAEQSGADIRLQTSVYHLQSDHQGWNVYTSAGIIKTPYVLLATGAAEIPVSLPGWTLPGVMTVGAAQVMANVHRVKPGNRGIIIGLNILSFAIARELQLCGVEWEAMVLAPNAMLHPLYASPRHAADLFARTAHLAPAFWMRAGGKLLSFSWAKTLTVRFFPKSGVNVWGIPVRLRHAATEIIGKEQVEGVRIVEVDADGAPKPGTERDIPVDFVCVSGGLYPLAELAAVAGCPLRYIPELGGHIPLHNEHLETPLKGLYVAGSITGIEGAKVAMAQGRVAGLSIAFHHRKGDRRLQEELLHAVRDVHQTRESAPIQFHPRITEGRKAMKELWNAAHHNG
jgi:sarcosine oxidase subunit alpha